MLFCIYIYIEYTYNASVSQLYVWPLTHNYIFWWDFFVYIICLFKDIYQITLFLKCNLIFHVIMFSQNLIDCTHTHTHTQTPWNPSNGFDNTTMFCFLIFFLTIPEMSNACLTYFLREKIIGNNYFCQAGPCVRSKISSLFAIIKPSTFSLTFTFYFWPFLWKQHFTINPHWIYISTASF